MKSSMGVLVLALLLAVGLFLLSGCQLEADEEATLLPQRGYGTFKLHVQDPGAEPDINEAGNRTGRRGFWYDADQDGDPDEFYQIQYPSAGIIALSFDSETGMADGGLPVAMTRMTAGQENYEIPLESLTSWIKVDQTVGYRKAQYVDDPNILVYMDRINDMEYEAPLTGNHQTFNMYLASVGTVNPQRGGSSNAEDPVPLDEEDEGDVLLAGYDDIDFTPARPGEAAAGCDDYQKTCKKESDCGLFAKDWTVLDCKQRLYHIDLDPYGKRYVSCVKRCSKKSCSKMASCIAECQDVELADHYSCDGEYGPETMDILYVVRRGSQVYRVEKGFTLEDGDQLAIFIDYADVEGDLGGGEMVVTFGGNTTTFDLPNGLGYNSFEDKAYIGFTVKSPLAKGNYDFTVQLIDGGCGNAGSVVNGRFASGGQSQGFNSTIGGGRIGVEMFEIFDTGLNKFNLGKGFIDVRSIAMMEGANFLYELYEFDVAIVQAYIWTFVNTDKFTGLTWNDINKLIFTTTHDSRGTKYDETDDIQSMAFYIDQPMSAGLFTFYGDAGWNIYPKSPYGDNDEQPFMRGDFENTRIEVPFRPMYQVDEKYTGCNDTCDYWLDYVYDFLKKQVRGFGSKAEALANCKANSADAFWRELFFCYKKTEAMINGCQTVENCVADVPTLGNTGPICRYADDIYLKVRVHINPAYLANEEFRQALFNEQGLEDWEPLRLGVLGQDRDTGEWSAIPGATVPFEYGKTNYKVSLPYMPMVPNKFLQIQTAESSAQSQLYLGLWDSTWERFYGSGYYEANDDLDGEWIWLVVYTYNWADPAQEGWSVGPVLGNTIYGWVNLWDEIFDIEFGDNRAFDGTVLEP